MQFGFSYIGLIWIVMLMVPNLIWTKNQPKDYEKYVKNENKFLLALERAGEFIVTPVALIFSDFNYKGWNFWAAVLILSFLCMVLYEIFWIRYFRSAKTMQDFYSGILGIPVAGATLPVIAFFLLGIYGGNIIMIIGSIILGTGHIGIHLAHRREVCGKKPKKHIAVRIILGILKGAAALILILVSGAFIICIACRNYNQVSRALRFRNGVNEQIYVQLNDQEEYITISGEKKDNPVIISLHGGPGAPTAIIDYAWTDVLADEYTIVNWDERGCGRSYYHNIDIDPDNSTLSFEQQLSDLDALVDYCCDRFGQDKVIIAGHSYGSLLGSSYVLAHPEKVSAYIGIGQVINEKDWYGETYSYEDALRIARERGDDTTAMEEAYQAFLSDFSLINIQNLRTLVAPYHPQGNTTDNSTWVALSSPLAGVDDMRWYLLEISTLMGDTRFERLQKSLDDQLMSFNIYDQDHDFQMPVMFISGSDDWVCPAGMVEEFAEEYGYYYHPVTGCGHSPQAQIPEEFAEAVRKFLHGTAD
ncbi:MAG: alpha/beta hydrolase [Clostridiales bacterium]|nr:alpha/beta hydrolase [Clostridiales bacterium]